MARASIRISTLHLSSGQFRALLKELERLSVTYSLDAGDLVVSPKAESMVRSLLKDVQPRSADPVNGPSKEESRPAETNISRPDSKVSKLGKEVSKPDEEVVPAPPTESPNIQEQLQATSTDQTPQSEPMKSDQDTSSVTASDSRQNLGKLLVVVGVIAAVVLIARAMNSNESSPSLERSCAAYRNLRTNLLAGGFAINVEADRLVATEGFGTLGETGIIDFFTLIDDFETYETTTIEREEYWLWQFSQGDSRIESVERLCSIPPVTTIPEAQTTIPEIQYTEYIVAVPEGWVYRLKMPTEPFKVTFDESVAASAPGESQLLMTVDGLKKPLVEPDRTATPGRNPPSKELFVHYYLPTGAWNGLAKMKFESSSSQCRSASQPNYSCRFITQTDDIAVPETKRYVSEVEPENLIQEWVRQARDEGSAGIWEVELWTPDTASTNNCSVYFDVEWNLVGPVGSGEFMVGAPDLANIDGWSRNDFSRPSCPEVVSETGEVPQPLFSGANASGLGQSQAPTFNNPIPVSSPFPSQAPPNRCSREAIGEDYGTLPFYSVACSGAWAITGIQECPPESECEGTDIFRWTDEGWTHRGRYYSLCVLMIDESGLPRSINDEFFPGNSECRQPIEIVAEAPFGPLSLGDVGERVRRVQRRLIELSLLNDVADGRFGPNTQNAIFDLQHLTGLSTTGIADEATFKVLGLSYT